MKSLSEILQENQSLKSSLQSVKDDLEVAIRALEIEASLEKIRARTMEMYASDDLQKVIYTIFSELKVLGIKMDVTIVEIFDSTKNSNIWVANPKHDYAQMVIIPYTDHPILNRLIRARKKKETFFTDLYTQEEKNSFYRHAFHHSELKQIPVPMQNIILSRDGYARSAALTDSTALYFFNLDGTPYDREENDLLKRFSQTFAQAYRRFLDIQKAEEQTRNIESINNENERLLYSILPAKVAKKIRSGNHDTVERYNDVTILFADLVGFTELSENLDPDKLVNLLNGLFSSFDDLTDQFHLEKIKTIGDAYMVAAGVPVRSKDHAHEMFRYAQAMLIAVNNYNREMGIDLNLRIGMSSGPVVAGVIGKKKFAYDLWGDTVNTAARMEAYGLSGKIQLSPPTYELLKSSYSFQKISKISIKGKGIMDVYRW